jgi:uncharacterized membrane protein YgdD (TMEM256/DUF423 family)
MPWAFWPSWAWRGAAVLLLMGAAIFSATLYAMAVGAPHWLGAITPIGGTLMIAGWLRAALDYHRAGGIRG